MPRLAFDDCDRNGVIDRCVIDKCSQDLVAHVLNTEFVLSKDLDAAISEVLDNVERLVVAGAFTDAHELALRLSIAGPLQIPKHGRCAQRYSHILELACFLAWSNKPEIHERQPERSWGSLAAEAKSQADRMMRIYRVQDRNQLRPAGIDWSVAYFDEPSFATGSPESRQAVSDFLVDVEFVLKARLNAESRTTDIALSEFASAVTTSNLVDALAECAKYHAGVYLVHDGLLLALLVCLQEDDKETATRCAEVLVTVERGVSSLAFLAVVPVVRTWLSSAALARSFCVSAEQVEGYGKALDQRRPVERLTGIGSGEAAIDVIQSPAVLTELLAQTKFASRTWETVPVLDSDETVLVASCCEGEAREFWATLRDLVQKTGRWPVVSEASSVDLEDLFSRFYFEEEPSAEDISPRGVAAHARTLSAVDTLVALDDESEIEWSELVDYELSATEQACGEVPAPEVVAGACLDGKPLASSWDLDRWLLAWELEQGASIEQLAQRQDGFSEPSMIILLLPTSNSWEALGYLHWYGAGTVGSPACMALGYSWQKRWGAEIYAHFGTMFECVVSTPPKTLEEAWPLAREQHLLAPYSLHASGLPTRHLAAGLVNHDHWFFHERP